MIGRNQVERPGTSVVIATRDRPHALQRLLFSLEKSGGYGDIVVVDDGSDPPASVEQFAVTLLRLNDPQMVSAARNEGAKRTHGEVILFVDDDCVVAEGAIEAIRREFERAPDVGVVGPVIGFLNEPDRIWCAGVVRTHWLARTIFRGRGSFVTQASMLSPDCADFPSAFAVRRSCFDLVGGFDSVRFPMHMEEADLAARVRGCGYRAVLAAGAIAWHDISPTQGLSRSLHLVSPYRAHLAGRGRTLFIRRHSEAGLHKALAMTFWLGFLVPAYILALVSDTKLNLSDRLRYSRLFLRGVREGMVMPV
jgi:GT2 family glycosyltransferase